MKEKEAGGDGSLPKIIMLSCSFLREGYVLLASSLADIREEIQLTIISERQYNQKKVTIHGHL